MKKLILFLLLATTMSVFGQVDAVAPKYDLTRPNPKTTAQIQSMTRMQEGSEAWNTDTKTIWRYNGTAWADTGDGLSSADIDTFAELDAIVADKSLANLEDAQTFSGTIDFTGAVNSVPIEFQGVSSGSIRAGATTNDIFFFNMGDDAAIGNLDFGNLTASRIFTFPDTGGTIALTSDITWAGLPVDDTTSLVQDPVDNTKTGLIDVGNVATGNSATLIISNDNEFVDQVRVNGSGNTNYTFEESGTVKGSMTYVPASNYLGFSNSTSVESLRLYDAGGAEFFTNLTADSFIKDGATSDDVLLGDGTTTSLAGINTDDQTATEVSTNTTNFNGVLSVADDNVQKALETLDEIASGSGLTATQLKNLADSPKDSIITASVDSLYLGDRQIFQSGTDQYRKMVIANAGNDTLQIFPANSETYSAGDTFRFITKDSTASLKSYIEVIPGTNFTIEGNGKSGTNNSVRIYGDEQIAYGRFTDATTLHMYFEKGTWFEYALDLNLYKEQSNANADNTGGLGSFIADSGGTPTATTEDTFAAIQIAPTEGQTNDAAGIPLTDAGVAVWSGGDLTELTANASYSVTFDHKNANITSISVWTGSALLTFDAVPVAASFTEQVYTFTVPSGGFTSGAILFWRADSTSGVENLFIKDLRIELIPD